MAVSDFLAIFLEFSEFFEGQGCYLRWKNFREMRSGE